MAWNLSPSAAHVIIGLATIGSMTGLAAAGSVNSTECITVITGIAGMLLGTSSSAMGSAAGISAVMTQPPVEIPAQATPQP